MSDFEDKLNAILSSPDAMAQVAALAQQLTGGGEEPPPPEQEALPSSPGPPPPGEDAAGLLRGLDPALLGRFLPLLRELNQPEEDQRAALLHALRPFLKPARQEKVDRALQAARLIRVGKKLLGHLGE